MTAPIQRREESSLAEPPLTLLLGLPFHHSTMEQALEDAAHALTDGAGQCFITANLDFCTQARRDATLRDIVFKADRVYCDGLPLVWLSRLAGRPLPERVAGSDMVPRLLNLCAERGFSVYFLGSDEKTMREASRLLKERLPSLRIVGMHSPPYGRVQDWDNAAIAEGIRAAGTDLLLVACGCPKQERWIAGFLGCSGARLAIGIGASLDFIAGKQTRAPGWLQRIGLEWMWRMLSDPKRLAKRYAGNFFFLVRHAAPDLLAHRRTRARSDEPKPSVSETLTVKDLSRETQASPALMGECLRIVRSSRRVGLSPLFVSPPQGFLDICCRHGLHRYFPSVPPLAQPRTGIVRDQPSEWTVHWPESGRAAQEVTLDLLREISGARAITVDLSAREFVEFPSLLALDNLQKSCVARSVKFKLSGVGRKLSELIANAGFSSLP